MSGMIEWYEQTYDADEVVDLLGIEVEELVEAFPERAKIFYEGYLEATRRDSGGVE
jgi:hypothetical protein